MDNLEKIITICKVLDDNKAENILFIDTKNNSNVVDFFILATASSSVHIKSLIDMCVEKIGEEGIFDIGYREIYNNAKWQVLDLGEGFVHIFTKEEREKYNIEKLISEGGNVFGYQKLLKKKETIDAKQKKLEEKKIEVKKQVKVASEKKVANQKKTDVRKKNMIDKELYKIGKSKK